MIKLLTFDLDNTLWDVESVIRGAERALRDWLLERAASVARDCPPARMMQLRTELVKAEPALAHNLSELRRRTLKAAFTDCGYPEAEADKLSQEAFDLFIHHRHQVVYYPDTHEVLDHLASRYQLIALSNGNADISRLGLDGYFSESFSAARVGASKPAPDMFHAALRHAGAKASQAVHIGDHPFDDIQAARDVGMHTIWIPHASHDGEPARASRQVERLAELPSAIEGL